MTRTFPLPTLYCVSPSTRRLYLLYTLRTLPLHTTLPRDTAVLRVCRYVMRQLPPERILAFCIWILHAFVLLVFIWRCRAGFAPPRRRLRGTRMPYLLTRVVDMAVIIVALTVHDALVR